MDPSARAPAWFEWSTEAFARAHALDRPILLAVVTRWSAACREMDRRAFADPAVVGLVEAAWVPVRVDADLRPDIAERYTLGGWPTTAFLTATGAVIGGGTAVDARRLEGALVEVARQYRARRDELLASGLEAGTAPAVAQPASATPDLDAPLSLTTWLTGQFDVRWGGFGAGPKRASPAALSLLLRGYQRSGDGRLGAMAATTLDAMAASALWDASGGGFFRASAASDWSAPEPAKLLEVNAALLLVYVEAAVVLGEDRYRDVARQLLGYLDGGLRDASVPGFHPSEFLGVGDALPRADRVDPVFYVDSNARLAHACLRASALLDEPALAEAGIAILEHVVPAAYDRGSGVAHCLDPRPRVRGLLGDQVAVSHALLEAAAASGRDAYVDLAEELMRSCLRKLWDEGRGALLDRLRTTAGAGDVGRLAVPHWPLVANCEAAGVLARLAVLKSDDELAARALRILASFADDWPAHGLDGASYALAVEDVLGNLDARATAP
jgi:uncharacterized protein YyaL (SSP411 family)